MRVSLEAFLQGMTAATTGQIAGHLAGQQQADARDQQQFAQALQLAQLGGQEQDRRNALLTSQLPNLTPESQGRALTDLAAQPSALAPLANHPYIQRHPEYQSYFGQQQQPPAAAGAPGGFMGAAAGQPIPAVVTPAAPGGRNFAVGGKTYELKGVSKEQMAALSKQLSEATKGLEDYAPAATDPAERAKITGLLQSIRGLDMSTAEGYAEGRRLASEAGLYATYGRQAAQNAAERKKQQTADEEAAVGKEIRAHLAEQNPLAITPAAVRALYANWKGKDYSHLIKDVPDDQLQLGNGRLWDRRAQITGQLASQVNVDEKTQNILLSELRMINKRLGIENEPVPTKIEKRGLTPEEAAAERRRVEEEKRQAEEERRKAEKFPVEMEKLRAELDRIKKERNTKADKFSDAQKAKLDAAETAYAQTRVDVKNAGVSPSRVDLNQPPRNGREQAQQDLVRRMLAAEKRLYHTHQGLGLNPQAPDQSMWYRSKPAAAPPSAPPESPVKRVIRSTVKRVTDMVTGAQKAAAADAIPRERRAKIIQDLRHLDPTVTQAEINAELRRRNMLPAR